MSMTHFALLAKFGDTNIPLDKCCEEFFGLTPRKAFERARTNELPVPVFRLGSQKSPWLVDAKLLADFIEQRKAEALFQWAQITGN